MQQNAHLAATDRATTYLGELHDRSHGIGRKWPPEYLVATYLPTTNSRDNPS